MSTTANKNYVHDPHFRPRKFHPDVSPLGRTLCTDKLVGLPLKRNPALSELGCNVTQTKSVVRDSTQQGCSHIMVQSLVQSPWMKQQKASWRDLPILRAKILSFSLVNHNTSDILNI